MLLKQLQNTGCVTGQLRTNVIFLVESQMMSREFQNVTDYIHSRMYRLFGCTK
jgi:hypothetical protein